ncbi:MAG: zinc metallopeptidase [Planctomycetota bacterium]|nr:MAG: zinc metallopeptidase [Planctomycetota bacterium]
MFAFIYFDPLYFVIVGPAMLLALWAQYKVQSAYAEASQILASSGLTGAEVAAEICRRSGVEGVRVEMVPGTLTDHYDPRERVLRLSEGVYGGRSLAALGVAAHEAGHALQHGHGYAPLALRNGIVPLAALGGNLTWILIMAGLVIGGASGSPLGGWLILGGIVAFSLTVIFQLVNLPVEFDASRRAKALLVEMGMVREQELGEVSRVLSAAAMTYVAATLTAILTLIYLLMRFGNQRD